jgi:pimeloyl-ACP methyl ester carboxylesterase
MAAPPLWSSHAGTGPPLLLLHGVGATHADFTQVRGPLEECFYVLSIDLPGHGRSPRLDRPPTVAALTDVIEDHLDETGLDAVHVLGNSLGGRLAFELAARGRARSVVAIAPFGPAPPPERVAQGVVLVAAGMYLRLLRPFATSLAGRWWGRCALLAGVRARPWRATPAEAEELAGSMGARGYWETLLANATEVPSNLRAVSCPVVLAQGTADWISGGQTLRYALMMRGARMSWLPFAGHAAQGDVPDAVVALVRDAAALATSASGSRTT